MASETQPDDIAVGGDQSQQRALVAVNNRTAQLPALQWPYGASTVVRPEILTARPTPAELLHALRRRMALALGLGILMAGVLAGAIWYFVPVRYEAVALIRVFKQKHTVLDKNRGSTEEYETYKRTQQQMLLSPFVLGRALKDDKIRSLKTVQQYKDDPTGWLQESLNADYLGDSEVLRVSLKGSRRNDLPEIVNAVVKSYMSEVVNAERDDQLRNRDSLDIRFRKNTKQAETLKNELYKLIEQQGIKNPEDVSVQRNLALAQISALRAQSISIAEKLRDHEIELHMKQAAMEQADDPAIPERMLEAQLSADEIVQSLQMEQTQLSRFIKEQERVTRNTNHSTVIKRKEQLKDLEDRIVERKNTLRQMWIEAMSSQDDAGPKNLKTMQAKHAALKANFENVNGQIKQLEEGIKVRESQNVDVERMTEELKGLEKFNNEIDASLKALDIELDAEARVKLFDKATTPQTSDVFRKYIGVGLAGVFGFGLALFGIAYLEFHARRLNTTGEVREGLGVPVLGELPPLSGRVWRKIQAGGAAGVSMQGLVNESVDSVRARLVHTTSVESPRVVMVTSAESGEGKSTVASQLALSLARSGRRTLLVDGDIRNAGIHRLFDLPLEPGLCEVLRGDVQREVAIQPTRAANLYMLSAGHCCVRSVQAMSQAALHELLTTLKSEYEFVIIDAGPVLTLADPLLMGQHVDAAVLSVLRDVSRVPRVYEAVDRLRSVGIVVLGTVINGVTSKSRRKYGPLALTEQKSAQTPSETQPST